MNMEKLKNLNADISPDGTYIRRNNLPAKKIMNPTTVIEKAINNENDQQSQQSSVHDPHIAQKISEQTKVSETIKPEISEQLKPLESLEPTEPSEILINDNNQKTICKIQDIAPNEFYLNGKHIKFNKWKVKTRASLNNCHSYIQRRKVLVYDQMETFVPLDIEEFNYVLYRIREFSYNKPIKYSLTCNECGRDFDVAYNFKDLYRPINGFNQDTEFNHNINGNNVKIVFSSISPEAFEAYENIITSESDDFRVLLIDFAFHIKSINGKQITDYEKLLNDIETWDTDIFEMFFNDFNSIKFYVDTLNKVKCPHCLHIEVLNFDEFPNFYPDSWVVEG